MHGYDNVDPGKEDRPGERTLQDWAQLGRWLMCDAFIAFEQQPGADRGMVQLCRDVHQQLQAALVAARPEDGLPLLENGMGGLVAAAPPGLCEMLAELSAVVKVAGNLTQEQLAAVETMHAWLKSTLDCIWHGCEVAADQDPASKQQLFDGLASPSNSSKPLSHMSATELNQVACKDLGGAIAKRLHSTGLQAGFPAAS